MPVPVQPIAHYTFIPMIIVLGMTMTGESHSHPALILIRCTLFSDLMQDIHTKQYLEAVSFCAEPRPSLAQLLGPM